MALRAWIRAVACAIVLVLAPGCLAPTLPVPPPSASAELLSGTAVVTGHANPGAYVSCLNVRTETGVIVRADSTTGAFTLMIPANAGDGLQVWQEIGTNRSGALDLCVACGAPVADH